MSQVQPMVVVEKAIAHIQPVFEKIAQPMGNLVRYQEEARFAIQIMRANPYLQRCVPQTIEDAVLNVAAVGLSLNPIYQHGFLIPRRKGNDVVCCFDPGYRGLIKLAVDGGLVSLVQANAVYEAEERDGSFKITMGTNPNVIHNPNPLAQHKDMGEIIGAYCIAYVKGAPVPHVTWMPIDDILHAAEKSESFNPRDPKKKPSGPWVTDFQEMCVKTAIKRGRKQWPGGNARLDRAIDLSNQAGGYIEPRAGDIEGAAVQLINKEQADQLRILCKRARMRVARVYDKFECRVMEELPAERFKECYGLLLRAIAHRDAKHAEKDTTLYASDYEVSLRDLEDICATYESLGTLRENRHAD